MYLEIATSASRLRYQLALGHFTVPVTRTFVDRWIIFMTEHMLLKFDDCTDTTNRLFNDYKE